MYTLPFIFPRYGTMWGAPAPATASPVVPPVYTPPTPGSMSFTSPENQAWGGQEIRPLYDQEYDNSPQYWQNNNTNGTLDFDIDGFFENLNPNRGGGNGSRPEGLASLFNAPAAPAPAPAPDYNPYSDPYSDLYSRNLDGSYGVMV